MGPIAKIAVGEPNPNGGPMPRTGNFPPINTGPFPPGFPFPQPRNFPHPDSPRGGIFAQWLAKWRANHPRS